MDSSVRRSTRKCIISASQVERSEVYFKRVSLFPRAPCQGFGGRLRSFLPKIPLTNNRESASSKSVLHTNVTLISRSAWSDNSTTDVGLLPLDYYTPTQIYPVCSDVSTPSSTAPSG